MKIGIVKYILVFFLSFYSIDLYSAGKADLVEQKWPFDGFFGRFDQSSLQRGFQVYREVCAGCHGIRLISYRDLEALGYTNDDIKSIASEYEIEDGPNDEGEMFLRFAKPSDKFVGPYQNKNEARAANNGSYPPDLSLIVKARAGGADYLYNLLNGYKEVPEDFKLNDGMYYNTIYPGMQIAMPQPIYDDMVEYEDNTPTSQDQIIRDVTSFLAWTAEPELDERKSIGVRVLLFLFLLTLMLYAVKRKIWRDVE